MNNNSTFFYECTIKGKTEIINFNDIDCNFDEFDSIIKIIEKETKTAPINIVDKLIKLSQSK